MLKTRAQQCLNIDIAASKIVGREIMNLAANENEIADRLPEYLQHYFKLRLQHYRKMAATILDQSHRVNGDGSPAP
ncbi:DNA polymerase III subunit theta [Serratia ficaria]|uniref:DNA polymerase III subunit theta n=1 Tax=Serratia ficaria TaxID=61651 RepID=UPI00077C66C6|nr:DNA polymerase III subunit theta [Serratia ficaria]